MRATTSIAILTAGLAHLAASQSLDDYDRCADAVFNDPNLRICTSNPGISGLACFCTSDITGYDLTDATIALCAHNHFPVQSLKSLICNPNTQISTPSRKHSSPMVRIAGSDAPHPQAQPHARALPESATGTVTDTDTDTDELEQPRSLIYQVITETSTDCNCESTPAPAAAAAATHAPSGVSPQRASAAHSSSDILVHSTPSTSATGESESEKVVATSSAIMPSSTDGGEEEKHGVLFQGEAGRGVRLSVGAVVGGVVVGVLAVIM